MANPPPVRPWFRLAALRPVAAPAQPEPRPPLVLPTTRTNSAPSPPPKAQPTQPSEPIPPPPSNSSPAKGPTTSPGSSPDTKPMVQRQSTPVQSPPSPLTLPPSSQMKSNSEIVPKIPAEAESKNVIVQKTIEKPKERLNGNGNGNGKTGFAHKEKGNSRKLSDSEDSAMKVITIAGENTGAYMELIQSPNKHRFGGKPNYLHNSKTKSESEFSGSEEGNGNRNEKSKKGGRTGSSYPSSAFTNSNVQCVNNSLLYNTSCTHHNPGVRLSLSRKPFDEGLHHKEPVNGQHH